MAYDYGGYERNKRDIYHQHGQESITNAYGRFLSQQRGERSLGDMSRGFQRQYPGVRASFGQRGFTPGIKSGVQQSSMRDYVGDYTRSYGRTQQDMTQGLQQYDLNQSNLNSWKQQSLADLEAQKAQEIASTATNVQRVRGQLGGI